MSERVDRVAELFVEICDLPPSLQHARLFEIEQEQAELATELRSLLGYDAKDAQLIHTGLNVGAWTSVWSDALVSSHRSSSGQSNEHVQRLKAATTDAPERLGDYLIQGPLGQGGAGAVFAAVDEKSGHPCAIKLLHALGPEALQQLKREFRTVAEITHPNLIVLHKLIAEGDQWFIVMEQIQGQDFVRHVRGGQAEGPLQEPGLERLERAWAQLTLGLTHLHEQELLHLDIKPSNVLVDETGRVVVLDFGLVQQQVSEPQAQTKKSLAGTPAYMAPEQITGGALGARTDWFSAGVMLYEALTGQLPARGPVLQVLKRRTEEQTRLHDEVRARLPKIWTERCDALLAITAEERPLPEIARASINQRFVGRVTELAALQSAFEAAKEGRTQVALISGPSGIGKSALMRKFIGGLDGALVLSARCFERESVPYKALDSLLDALVSYLAALSPEHRAALLPRNARELSRVFPVVAALPEVSQEVEALKIDPQEVRDRGFRGLKDLLGRIANERPVVLHVDDLQWRDSQSPKFMAELCGPPDPPAMLLVLSFRSESLDAKTVIDELNLQGQQVSQIHLDALRSSDAEALARSMGVTEAEQLELLLLESAGVPFVLEELARDVHLHEQASAKRSYSELIEHRLRALSDEDRRLLNVAALASRSLPVRTASVAARLSKDAYAVVGRLIEAAFVRSRDPIELYHDRVREIVLDKLEPETQRALHAQLAEAMLELEPERLEDIALHAFEGGDRERAADYALKAASAAMEALAFMRAASFYERAIDWSEAHDEPRALLLRLAEALACAGRGPEAAKAFLSAAQGAEPLQQIEYQTRAAEQLLMTGRVSEGLAAIEAPARALSLSMPRSKGAALTALLFHVAALKLRGTRYTERSADQVDRMTTARIDFCFAMGRGLGALEALGAGCFFLKGIRLALASGEPSRIAQGLGFYGYLTMRKGDPKSVSKGLGLLAEAERAAERSGDHYAAACVLFYRGLGEGTLCRPAKSIPLIEQALEHFEQSGTDIHWERLQCDVAVVPSIGTLGQVDRAYEVVRRLQRRAENAQDVYGINYASVMTAFVQLYRGEPEHAKTLLANPHALLSEGDFLMSDLWYLQAQSRMALYEHRPKDALRLVQDAWPKMRRGGFLDFMAFRIEMCAIFASAAVDSGDLALGQKYAAKLDADYAEQAHAFGALIRAGVANLRGDAEARGERLRFAKERFKRSGAAILEAIVDLRLGEPATDRMRALGVGEPARLADMFSPGFSARSA